MALSKGQLMHIESLSVLDYTSHVNSQFVQYAACGIFRLGKIENDYVVLNRNSERVFGSGNPGNALEKYIELIKENS